MKQLAVLLIAMLLFGCGDTVTSRYATRAEAEQDRLFARGWLPGIIPASSRKIVTKNDLDVNTSRGSFSFNPEEAADFIARLVELDADPIPSDPEQLRIWEKGYNPYELIQSDSRWLFYIHATKGHCEYWLSDAKRKSNRYVKPMLNTSPRNTRTMEGQL
ncbi:hypothetical protein [Pontiella desulfatans]|nr:hypothetical protein [Pontiella desulfatans]